MNLSVHPNINICHLLMLMLLTVCSFMWDLLMFFFFFNFFLSLYQKSEQKTKQETKNLTKTNKKVKKIEHYLFLLFKNKAKHRKRFNN